MVANQCFNQSKAIIESLNQKEQESKLGFPQVPAQLRQVRGAAGQAQNKNTPAVLFSCDAN